MTNFEGRLTNDNMSGIHVMLVQFASRASRYILLSIHSSASFDMTKAFKIFTNRENLAKYLEDRNKFESIQRSVRWVKILRLICTVIMKRSTKAQNKI